MTNTTTNAPASFLARVYDLLQEADEIGGIEDPEDYIKVMDAIATEATRRAETCRRNQGPL